MLREVNNHQSGASPGLNSRVKGLLMLASPTNIAIKPIMPNERMASSQNMTTPKNHAVDVAFLRPSTSRRALATRPRAPSSCHTGWYRARPADSRRAQVSRPNQPPPSWLGQARTACCQVTEAPKTLRESTYSGARSSKGRNHQGSRPHSMNRVGNKTVSTAATAIRGNHNTAKATKAGPGWERSSVNPKSSAWALLRGRNSMSRSSIFMRIGLGRQTRKS